MVDKSENVNIDHEVSDKPMSEDEWTAAYGAGEGLGGLSWTSQLTH